MDIKQLRAFLAVARAQSFLGAAEEMYISRQAVSKTVTQLEDELGVKLFVRGQNGATLTPAGSHFYPQARALVADFDRLEREMKALDRRERPRLRLCLSEGTDTIFKPRLESYAAAHGGQMELQLTVTRDLDCDSALNNYRSDAVVSFTAQNSRSTTASVILESPIVFLVNNLNPLSREPVMELSWERRVANFLLYTGGRDHCLWWPVTARPGDIRCNDMKYLFQLLREDRGVLPIPEILVPERLSFAALLRGRQQVEPCRVYCSTLRPSFYDPGTHRLLEQIKNDVFLTAAGQDSAP